ncbi:MAG: uroporphyrinogen-III synthase [SAR324 cluster bacterium]
MSRLLRDFGARVVECPLIAFEPPASWSAFDARAARLQPGDWVVFTSATALRWSLRRLAELGRGAEWLRPARIAAIGEGTARALAEAGLAARLTPRTDFQAEGLRDALLPALAPGEPVWLPRAEQGRETLIEGLERAGHPVTVTPVYRTVPAPEGLAPVAGLLARGEVDWMVFTSSFMVLQFLERLPPGERSCLARVRIACLGGVTAHTARAHGLSVAALPERQHLSGLVRAMAAAESALGGARP